MKKLLLLTAALLTISTFAQKGKVFPTIEGLTLDGKAMSLPLKNGKETIVAMVFNRSAEDELKKWLKPLYETFMDKSGKKSQMDMSNNYDVNFFFIPAIGGMKMMISQFKSETDKSLWPYIFDTDRTDMKQQRKLLGIEDSGIPYVMVLDKDGKIKEVVSGNVKEDKIDKLEEACAE
jgi:hypothetical protein